MVLFFGCCCFYRNRIGGDKSLGTLVTLLIIDEVHLLADERGAVIETIVARTQRYVESSQKLVRIFCILNICAIFLLCRGNICDIM